jgi:hypothetical protein
MRHALERRTSRPPRGAVSPDEETQPESGAPVTRTRLLPIPPRRQRRARLARPLGVLAAIAVLFVLAIVGVLLWQRDSGDSSSPGTPATTAAQPPGATLPPALDRALDDLREAVQR